MLLNQSRYKLAEQELRHALAEQPNDATSHAALALSLAFQERFKEASAEAEAAIGLAPDEAFGFYAQAIVFDGRNRFADAQRAVRQAILLAPDVPDYYALLGKLQLDERRYEDALTSAEEGLAFDAEDTGCINVRARALVLLNRKDDAQHAIAASLARQPESASTHANMGWTLLEQGNHRQALEHFREALRLQPEMEWARLGIIEALKARNVFYRLVLKYFLWIGKFARRAQWGIIVGAYLVYLVLRRVAANNPELAPWIMPLLVLYVVWAWSTWMASPLFNVALLLSRFGRLALSREEKITGLFVGTCVLGAGASLALWAATGVTGWRTAAIFCGLMIPPVTGIHACQPGWPRVTMILITVLLLGLGYFATMLDLLACYRPGREPEALEAFATLFLAAFVIGSIDSQFAVNWLASVHPRR
jgi:tetratricopeptide (TPR) repeat protein